MRASANYAVPGSPQARSSYGCEVLAGPRCGAANDAGALPRTLPAA